MSAWRWLAHQVDGMWHDPHPTLRLCYRAALTCCAVAIAAAAVILAVLGITFTAVATGAVLTEVGWLPQPPPGPGSLRWPAP